MTVAAYTYDDQEESVYRLIPTVDAVAEKKAMYRSRHNAKIPPSYSTFGTTGTSKKVANPSGGDAEFDASGGKHKAKKPSASIGASVGVTVKTESYLKKRAGEPVVTQSGRRFERPEKERKTQVPKQTEKPVMGLTTEKNFVVSNAVDAILAPPKKAGGMQEVMTQKKDYGKAPGYLRKIKSGVEKEKQIKEELAVATATDPFGNRMRLLTEQEKRSLMAGMKQKWEQLNKAYQSLTFSMDTVTKVGRKELQEAELEKLEKAMAKISNKKCVFVYDDIGDNFASTGITGRNPKDAATL